MGRQYSGELEALPATYTWALEADIEPLRRFAASVSRSSLLAIGSGGSSTAAHFAAVLHRLQAGAFARHGTPLDALLTDRDLGGAAVMLLSASGRNRDAIAALEHCARIDARAVAVVCTQQGSKLALAAKKLGQGYVLECPVPSGRDGFLATNSLLATCVFLARAYEVELPPTLAFAGPEIRNSPRHAVMEILYGGWASPVATDLESKLNEAALGSAQIADYRNFGHGRHLRLARYPDETLVVQLITPETAEIAAKVKALLPDGIDVVEVATRLSGPAGAIELMAKGFAFVGSVARNHSIDPGRPQVPTFGRRLYHLPPPQPSEERPAPIRRKERLLQLREPAGGVVTAAFKDFTRRLARAQIRGLVLDYDGTLCSPEERFTGIRPEISQELQRLLNGGLILGVASGRGRSVREALQRAVKPTTWNQVVLGYYNGGELAPLADDTSPDRDAPLDSLMELAHQRLGADPLLRKSATVTARRAQITVETVQSTPLASLAAHVMSLLATSDLGSLRIAVSSHTVDVLPPGQGKLAVVDAVRARLRGAGDILCIGDRGAWPGNDWALLTSDLSLSVDDVSPSLVTCWNLLPAGITGPEGTFRYLRAIRLDDDCARFVPRGMWRRQ